ncbi:TetR-like C-terminal domain-containing protein [Quadrisphaera sp. DSM 44207]|uniref:TetR-like C-terminal domain-containing protein n=1 Tax=Quadrisphaera sp. DSM 44207 TaxID=1881057 RepID=UPI00088BC0F3|nr:TetR-like C-terminal domain-containing protein [Quadrisphaera sp. DSM 44207]SDQ16030.1 transcriptional regulator, TetR family [Quadrisphaera sp. DSM 44207]
MRTAASTRDELLTALVVEAYDGVGAAVEEGAAPARGRTVRARFVAACRALRAWAHEHPHQYALLHGSPGGGRGPEAAPSRPLAPALAEQAAQVAQVAEHLGEAVGPEVLVRAVRVWTALHGLVSCELFGQLARTVDSADAPFAPAPGPLLCALLRSYAVLDRRRVHDSGAPRR